MQWKFSFYESGIQHTGDNNQVINWNVKTTEYSNVRKMFVYS